MHSRITFSPWVILAFLALQLPVSVPGQPVYTPFTFSTLAGCAGTNGTNDGLGTAARFGAPHSVAVDSAGCVYVADMTNHVIRKITPHGQVTTLAGAPGQAGSADGIAGNARFNGPRGVAVGPGGVVYVADAVNNTIRKIWPNGLVTTLAGQAGQSGSSNGLGSTARFSRPNALVVNRATTNIYVTDAYNHTIRAITPGGMVTTVAGLAGNPGSVDANGSAARFRTPSGIAVDAGGRLFVADEYNHAVRMILPNGDVSTFAGLAGTAGTTDGTGGVARFHNPHGCAIDRAGNLYVSEMTNQTVRRITSLGVVTTIAGTARNVGGTDGTGAEVRFAFPRHTAVDEAGNVYVADFRNYTIRKGWAVDATPIIFIRQITAADGQAFLYFYLVTGTAESFTLQHTHEPNGPWSTDENATWIPIVPGVSYQFTTPINYPFHFFRVQTP